MPAGGAAFPQTLWQPLSTKHTQGGPPGLGCLAVPCTKGASPTSWPEGWGGGGRGSSMVYSAWWYPWDKIEGVLEQNASWGLPGTGSQTQVSRGQAQLTTEHAQVQTHSVCIPTPTLHRSQVKGGRLSCPRPHTIPKAEVEFESRISDSTAYTAPPHRPAMSFEVALHSGGFKR